MTTPEPVVNLSPEEAAKEEKKRRTLLLILLGVLLLLCVAGCLILRYLLKPAPIADVLPVPAAIVASPPTYVKKFDGVDAPVGVAVSPDAQRIYVTESKGERLVKVFDRDGNPLFSFFPPGTTPSNRVLTFIAVGPDGRVYLSERYNGVIDIFDADGNFIDAIIDRDMTLSKFISNHTKGILPPGTLYHYDNLIKHVIYQTPGGDPKAIPGPERKFWTPLGLRFDKEGDLVITNTPGGQHEVLIFPAVSLTDLLKFDPQFQEFGMEGNGNGQFSFPVSAVKDSKGNFYISDGNNGRISFWTADRVYQSFFGYGSSETSLNLPRGLWMDSHDFLHVTDAVGQAIRVYDVSAAEPAFLFSFGDLGIDEGNFNFPIDICMDSTGRVYVADRENNRIDIWSY